MKRVQTCLSPATPGSVVTVRDRDARVWLSYFLLKLFCLSFQAEHLIAEYVSNHMCLEAGPQADSLRLSPCEPRNALQKWQFTHYLAWGAGLSVNQSDTHTHSSRRVKVLNSLDEWMKQERNFGDGGRGGGCGHLLCGVILTVWGRAIFRAIFFFFLLLQHGLNFSLIVRTTSLETVVEEKCLLCFMGAQNFKPLQRNQCSNRLSLSHWAQHKVYMPEMKKKKNTSKKKKKSAFFALKWMLLGLFFYKFV